MSGPTPWSNIEDSIRARDRSDPFVSVRDATNDHRRVHRCWAYPYADGTLLGAISAALRPSKVLEFGTALGYTACWWADGGAQIDTIDHDSLHVELARETLARFDLSAAATVHQNDFAAALEVLKGPYDLVFFDGYAPSRDLLVRALSVTAENGVLITANLDLARGKIRSTLTTIPGWTSRFVADLALTTRAGREDA